MRCDRKTMRLYAVTDRAWVGQGTLGDQVEQALRGGVTCVQLREKSLGVPAILVEAEEIGALCRSYGVPFLINDRVEIALQCGADGVHVGQKDRAARSGTARIIWGSAQSFLPPPRRMPCRCPMRLCRPFAGRCPSLWWPLAAFKGRIFCPWPEAA